MGSSSNTVVEKSSPLDQQRAKYAGMIGPYIMQYIMEGMGGVPSSQQALAALNMQNQLKQSLGRVGVNPGDPRMFEMFRRTTEGMTKPSADIMSTALSLYTGIPGTGGGSTTTTNPGLMGTLGGIANLGMAGLGAYGIGQMAGLYGAPAAATGLGLGTTALAAHSIGAGIGGGAAAGYGLAQTFGPLLALGSSIELKQDIEPMESQECLEKVCSLRSVGYKWKHSEEQDAGLIAEELTEVIPEAGAMVGGYNGIKPLTVIGYLVESIKQLNNEITELKAQIGGDG